MPSRVWLKAAVVLAAFAAAPAVAHADASQVVLLRSEGDDPLARQAETLLAAELRAAGFAVAEVDRKRGGDIRADIEATSSALQPVATLAIVPGGRSAVAEVWLADRVTGKLVIRRVDTAERPASSAAADLALRAVELLRGSLLEVTADTPVADEIPEPPADVARFIEEAAPDGRVSFLEGWGIGVGASVLQVPGGFGPTFAPALRLSRGSARGFAVRLSAIAPGLSRGIDVAAGRAEVRQDVALLEGAFVFRRNRRLQPFIAIGAGAQHVRASGRGSDPLFPEGTGRAFAAALSAGGGAAMRLGPNVAVVFEGAFVFSAPSTKILVAGEEVATLGRAFFTTSACISTAF